MYYVKISNTACGHLRFLLRSIALTDAAAAQDYTEQINRNFQGLSQGNPNEFYYFNARGIKENKYHRMLIADRFLAIFYLDGNMVYVDYVIDLQTECEWLNNM